MDIIINIGTLLDELGLSLNNLNRTTAIMVNEEKKINNYSFFINREPK